MLLFLLLFVVINIGLLFYCKCVEKSFGAYNIDFCRDVRVLNNKFVSSNALELKRRRLLNSKF